VEQALKEGADEFDMVINVGWLKSKLYRLVHEDIAEVVKAAGGKVVKVIIETCYLTDDEKRLLPVLLLRQGLTTSRHQRVLVQAVPQLRMFNSLGQ